jgi:methylated-DNA-[protein]-cysteine S-methyltransferase
MDIIHTTFITSFGWCGLIKGKKGLKRIFLPEKNKKELISKIKFFCPLSVFSKDGFEKEIKDIIAYFSGENKKFSFILDFSGSTNFQRMVWSETAKIPYAQNRTYQFIAEKIGKKNSARAVGNALGKNPFPVVVPCHRVVRSDGTMGGFTATGGIKLKQEMLKLEGFRCMN